MTLYDFKLLLEDQREPLTQIWKKLEQHWTTVDLQQLVQNSQITEALGGRKAVNAVPQINSGAKVTSRDTSQLPNQVKPGSKVYYSSGDLISQLNILELTSPPEKKPKSIQMPYEIQLKILDHLQIYEADSIVRQSLPSLATLWYPVLHVKFRQWFTNIFSRDNMRYIGTTDRGHDRVWSLWRLRSLDMHPDIVLRNQYSGSNRTGRHRLEEPPALADTYGYMMFIFLGLIAELDSRRGEKLDDLDFFKEFWINVGRDYLRQMDPQERKGCLECCEKVAENGRMAFVLSLGWCWCCDDPFVRRSSHICETLLLYKDELDVILANFKVIMSAFDTRDKEIFKSSFLPSSLRDIEHIGPVIAIQTDIYEEGRSTALERCDIHAN